MWPQSSGEQYNMNEERNAQLHLYFECRKVREVRTRMQTSNFNVWRRLQCIVHRTLTITVLIHQTYVYFSHSQTMKSLLSIFLSYHKIKDPYDCKRH